MPSANTASASPPTALQSSSTLKDNLKPMNSRFTELNESRTQLLDRIQGLKQDVQNWRSKLDTQVNICRNELAELKKSLNDEAEQLRSEFQGLRTTLQQQQDDVTAGLKNLALQDTPKEPPVPLNKVEKDNSKDEDKDDDDDVGASQEEDKKVKEEKAEESEEEESEGEI